MIQLFQYPHEALLQTSTAWTEEDTIDGYDNIELFERDLIMLMKMQNGLGLAANQVGITKRFFCIGYDSFDVFKKPVILWNPLIVRSSEETTEDVEGCLSFPNIWIKVRRPKKVTVRWQNLKGETCMQHLDNLESKCFQHELDHIDGITFNTRVSKLKWDIAKKKAQK